STDQLASREAPQLCSRFGALDRLIFREPLVAANQRGARARATTAPAQSDRRRGPRIHRSAGWRRATGGSTKVVLGRQRVVGGASALEVRGWRTDPVASERRLRCRVRSGSTAREVRSFPRSEARRRLAALAVHVASAK